MKLMNRIFTSICVAVLLSASVFAQDFIVKVGDLKTASKDAVVVDVYTAANYGKMHIDKAINIFHKDLYKTGDIEGVIKDPVELAKIFGDKGINVDSKIIIYDNGSQKYNSRVFWILKYMGAKNVYLLHKDMDQFRKARVRLTRKPGAFSSTTFVPAINDNVIANTSEVLKVIKNNSAIIIDARDAVEYAGNEKGSKGHIKNAINIDYKLFLDDKGAYKSKTEIAQLAKSKGLSTEKDIIVYCASSIRAAVIYVALKEILGYENVKVYDEAYNTMVVKHPEMIVK